MSENTIFQGVASQPAPDPAPQTELRYPDMGVTDVIGVPIPNFYAKDMPLSTEQIRIDQVPGRLLGMLSHARTIGAYNEALAHFRGILEGAEIFSPELKAQLQSLGAEAHENRLDKEKSERSWGKIEAVLKTIKTQRR